MTIKEAAAAWGITERRVNALCKAGRISGAYKEGRQWFIPDSTQKPVDKRGHRSAVKPAVSSVRKPLPIGVSDYRDACKNYYYVDKTLMIKEFLDERPKVSLFTRPRRFGKTLNMDMLRTFFEKTTEDTSVYFRDKKIWSCGESYLAHHRKYPVIFLSFKDVKYTSWEETYQTLQKLIAQEFRRHDELASSSALSDYEKEEYSLLATEAADEVEYQMSLRTLTLLLHKHHDVAPIVIIDEYDTPIQQGHVSGFYDTIIGFMRNLFSGGLKDNPHLSYGFLTGILRVAKESIFSGLNNLKINSILDERYSEYFGFTSSEVHEMADYYHASDKYQELCEWYDGYLFGNTEIFNPWSVIGYFNNNCRPKAFWQSTGLQDTGYQISGEQIRSGMEKARWNGRFTILKEDPYLVVDGAHNPDAARKLQESLRMYFPNREFVFLMGVFRDKQYETIAERMAPMAREIIAMETPDNPRALPAKELGEVLCRYKTPKQVYVADSLEKALQLGMKLAGKEDVIVAFGSLSFIGDLTKLSENLE